MEAPTPLARLIEAKLGENLHGWLGRRRRDGNSWRAIAMTLQDRTREQVTDVTVASWYADLREPRKEER